MAAKDFKVTISGEDNLSQVLNKINKAFENMFAPVDKAGASINKAVDSAPVKLFNKTIADGSQAARDLAVNIQSVIPAMGELAAIATIGGLGALPNQWGDLARKIDLTKKYTGETTDRIQELTGAAKMAGIETGTTMDTIASFQQRLQGAIYGRDNDFYALAKNTMHLEIGGPGAVAGAYDVIKQIATRVGQEAPTTAKLELDRLGLTSLAPLLINGRKQLDEYIEVVRRAGYVQSEESVDAANKYKNAIFESETAVNSLGNSIGQKLIPVFNPLIDKFNTFIEKNRDIIAEDIAKTFDNIATAVSGAATAFYKIGEAFGIWDDKLHSIEKTVEFLSGTAIFRMLGMSTPLAAAVTGGAMAGSAVAEKTSPYFQQTEIGQRIGDTLSGNAPEFDIKETPTMHWMENLLSGTLFRKNPETGFLGQPSGDSSFDKPTVTIDIIHANVPKGTKIVTSSTGNVSVNSRTQSSMPNHINVP